MVMIRLARIGKKKYPTYRIVVSDKQKDTKGSYLESLGQYNPHTEPSKLEVNKERLDHWLGVGAQLSDTLHNLCVSHKLIDGEKRSVLHKNKKQEKENEKAEEPKVETPKADAEVKDEKEEAKPKAKPEEIKEEPKQEPEKKDEEKSEDKK